MKKVILATSMVVMSLVAADYSQMTMEELNNMKGTVTLKDKEEFRTEMQSRMQAMTPQERQTYMKNRGNVKAQGQGIQQRLRDGSGAGQMNKGANHGGK